MYPGIRKIFTSATGLDLNDFLAIFCNGCFIHRSPQSPDITWTNILSFSFGITGIWPDPNLDFLYARQSDAALFLF